MPRRTGKSLIELIVVIGVMSVAMGLAVRSMAVIMRSDAAGSRALQSSLALSRLAEQFRRDVHAAAEAELREAENGQTQFLRLRTAAGALIEYHPRRDHILRTTLSAGNVTTRESFHLQTRDHRIEISAESRLVSLILLPGAREIPGPAAGSPAAQAVHVEALRGRDLRFMQQETSP